MEKDYHNYPDVNVTKRELCKSYFPMSETTLNRRLKEMVNNKQYRDVLLSTGGKVLINVRGFYYFLANRQKNKFKI